MKLHQLRALVAVARSGSIHEAARTLHLTQPAVTRSLRDLEDELGLMLVARSSSGVTLTDAGRAMLRRAELVVNEVARTEEEMAQLRENRQGRLAIGMTPLAGITVLPAAYNRFRRAMPDVQLEFVEGSPSQLVEQLKNGALDFALGAGADAQDFTSVRCEHLDSFPMWFAVSRKGKLAGATSLADLQDAEWLHTGPSTEFRAFLAELFAQAGLPVPRRVTRCASQTLFYALAVNSDVVTAWTQLALRGEDASDTLKTLDLVGQPPARNLYLLFRDSAVLTASAEYFVRCIDEAVQAERAHAGGTKRGTRSRAPRA
ncbi:MULTISPECIES: LysR family transcriptional regulator [Burkholderia]|uniref:LysR family transcriptional regulator n=1 Tax=Burkholderia lata (strain ATCC 17760 / DSM 23089 / LMG 22485 / NCIMB 9086 / R18194 / 383) TaxID=482957 RepID=A0A6P2PHJ1_BURL3|nr:MULTISPECIES: LysR substrate-binding domain-containing protein [Burkholderia]MBN3769047.1 LysR family transcriptional regulator [Burkholderia sp. Se-20378]VWC05956.1 LysR family transcriptional regulator [Burkholderia lata]